MKKSLKISTMILASGMLMSGGGAFLANSFNSQQNTSILNYQSAEARADTVQNSEIIYKTLPENLAMDATHGLVYKDGSLFDLYTSLPGTGTAVAHAEKLELLIDLEQFPADAIFKTTAQVPGEMFDDKIGEYFSVDLENSTYSFNLCPSKYYENGQIMENISDYKDPIMKFYEVVINVSAGLNSRIKFKQIPVGLGANTIDDMLFLGETGFNMEIFLQMFELIDFPEGDIIFNRVHGEYGTYDAKKLTYTINLFADKSYENSKIVGVRHITVVVQGLKQYADSAVMEKTITSGEFFAANISDLLGTTTVNMVNLAKVATLLSFPSDATFTIENPNVDFENGVYTSSLKPSKYYLNGIEVDNTIANPPKIFPIRVSGLKGVENSEVINKQIPGDIDLNNVQDKLKNADGNTVNRDVLGQLIYLTAFPENTAFTADFANSITDQNAGIYTLNMTADKQYIDGKAVDQPKNFELKLQGFYVAPAPTTAEDNTGLTVGLVIGGVVLVLLLVGLYIWNKKRIQAAGGTPDGKDGKAKESK